MCFFSGLTIDFFEKKGYNIFMELYVHEKEFFIKYCDVDFKDELKASATLSYLEEVACSSADELGFGYAFVKPRGYAFMVSNICCRFLKPVCLGQTVKIRTWPTPPTHVIFGREYQILSKEGGTLINASSRWCLVDRNTGKLLPSKAVDNQDYTTYNTNKILENVNWRILPVQADESALKFSMTVANSEYDHNMHVNNTRYADYCFNCFSIAELSKMRLKEFCISYVKQCREGETLRFYRKDMGNGEYLTQGFNDVGETVVLARIIFEEWVVE